MSCYFLLCFSFEITAASPGLHGLTLYRARLSPVSSAWDSRHLSKVFRGCTFSALVCEEVCWFLVRELVISRFLCVSLLYHKFCLVATSHLALFWSLWCPGFQRMPVPHQHRVIWDRNLSLRQPSEKPEHRLYIPLVFLPARGESGIWVLSPDHA